MFVVDVKCRDIFDIIVKQFHTMKENTVFDKIKHFIIHNFTTLN